MKPFMIIDYAAPAEVATVATEVEIEETAVGVEPLSAEVKESRVVPGKVAAAVVEVVLDDEAEAVETAASIKGLTFSRTLS